VQDAKGKRANGRVSVYAALSAVSGDQALSYGQVGADLLQECISAVTSRGDALLLGRTTDGGALSIHVLSGGQASKFYVTDASELMELLQGLIAAVNAAS